MSCSFNWIGKQNSTGRKKKIKRKYNKPQWTLRNANCSNCFFVYALPNEFKIVDASFRILISFSLAPEALKNFTVCASFRSYQRHSPQQCQLFVIASIHFERLVWLKMIFTHTKISANQITNLTTNRRLNKLIRTNGINVWWQILIRVVLFDSTVWIQLVDILVWVYC